MKAFVLLGCLLAAVDCAPSFFFTQPTFYSFPAVSYSTPLYGTSSFPAHRQVVSYSGGAPVVQSFLPTTYSFVSPAQPKPVAYIYPFLTPMYQGGDAVTFETKEEENEVEEEEKEEADDEETSDVIPGYVAKTLAVTHEAPLPEGLGYASHHINLQPAPGTE